MAELIKRIPPRRGGVVSELLDQAPRFGLVGVLILVIVAFSIIMPSTYFTRLNFISIATNQAVPLLLALAVLIPLTAGEFDLSVANNFGLAQLLIVGLLSRNHLPVVTGILMVIGVGCLIGAVNAFLIVKLQVNSFIATLGMATILSGAGIWYAHGEVIFGNLPNSFLGIGQDVLLGVPTPVIYGAVASVLLWLVLTYTVMGRQLYAVGGNRIAARLTGIKTGKMLTISFIVCGGIAAATGVVIGSQLGSGQPLLGPNYLLPAYAGAFLGATTIAPGRFNVWGTVVAAYLLGAGVTGLQQLGVPDWVEEIFNGSALIAAVAASGYLVRARTRWRRSNVGGDINA